MLALFAWRASDARSAFDAARWKADGEIACSESYDGARKRMVGDLRDNHLSTGLTPREVRALLGEPQEIFRDPSGHERWLWATASGFTRCWYLSVIFADGRLVATDHYY